MEFEIRQLQNEAEFVAAQFIFCQAYPSFKNQSSEQRDERTKDNMSLHKNDWMKYHGVWQNGELCAMFIMFEFEMNFRGLILPIGGIGAVAVALSMKKRHAAQSLIKYYIETNRAKGSVFTGLYPFRPDFYKKMGYAYGFQLHEYRFPAERLLDNAPSNGIVHLDKNCPCIQEQLAACYSRYHQSAHGALNKWERWWKKAVDDEKIWFVGEYRDGKLGSYMAFRIEKLETGNGDGMDLCVEELIGADMKAWVKYRTFLANQSDQFRTINITTAAPDFHYNFKDSRIYDNAVGVGFKFVNARQEMGMMLRVCEPKQCWEGFGQINFGGYNGSVGFVVHDSLLQKEYSFAVEFSDGLPRLTAAKPDICVKLDIAEYTALLMGSADARALCDYGLIESEAQAGEILGRIFNSCANPENVVFF